MGTRSARDALLVEGPQIRRRLLLALVVLVPLLFLRTISDPINVPKLGLLIAVVSLVAVIRVAEGLQDRDFAGLKLVWVPAAALTAPLLVGWVFSPYKGWALWGVYPRMLGLLPYLFVIAFALFLADAFRGDALPVARALAIAGAIAGGYACLQSLGLDPYEWSLRSEVQENIVVSTLGNSNFAGAFLAITLPVAAALLTIDPQHLRWRWGVAAVLIAGGLLATRSEAAWAAGVAAMAVVTASFLAPRWRFARVAGAVAVAGVALLVAGSVITSIAGIGDSKIPGTVSLRGEWWKAAVGMASASPVFGRGPNAFALEHPQYRTAEDVRQSGLDITDDPHSVFLSYLTSAGAIGAIGYLFAVGWVVKTARETPSEDLLPAAFLAALTAYFIQSLVSIDTIALRSAGWVALAGFVAARAPAVAVATPSRSKKKRARQEPLRALPAIAAAGVLGLTGVWAGGQLILKDGTFRHAGNLLDDGEGEAALDAYEESISFNGNVHYRRAYGNVLGDVAVAIGPEGEPFMDQARTAFGFVHELPQVNAALDYARTLKEWAAIEPSATGEAADAYSLAVSYDPIDVGLITQASTALLELGAEEEAIALLEPVVERFDQAGLWGNLALAQARLDQAEEARTSIARALALDPATAAALEAQEILKGAGSPP